jgi:CRP-like cAMP-binding protein
MKELLSLATRLISLSKNEFLCSEGKIDTNIYFIHSGCLKVFFLDEGNEQIIRFGYSNNFIAALDSFLLKKPGIYFIQALKPCSVSVIPGERVEDLLLVDNDFKNKWIELLGNLVVQQMEREIDLLISSPEERFQRVLSRSPQVFQEVPRKYIANYLRMSPETLSRIKKY